MRHLLGIVLTLSLAGCAFDQTPEPVIHTTTVDRVVVEPCQPVMPERPELLTKQQLLDRLGTLPKFDDRMKLVMAQLINYMGWTTVQGAALAVCRNPDGDATTRPK